MGTISTDPIEINESSGKSKSELLDLVSSITDPPAAVSPLHRTPERPQNEILTPPKEMSPKLHSLSEKLNGLTNMVSLFSMLNIICSNHNDFFLCDNSLFLFFQPP